MVAARTFNPWCIQNYSFPHTDKVHIVRYSYGLGDVTYSQLYPTKGLALQA